MGGGRQRRPLHGRPLVAPVVPQHDLPRVRPSDHNVRVELGERRRHDSGLTVGGGEGETREKGIEAV